MKRGKKFLSVLCSLCLLLSFVPLSASAAPKAASSTYQKVSAPEDGETYVFYTEISNNLELSDSAGRLLKSAYLDAVPPDFSMSDKNQTAVTSTTDFSMSSDENFVYTSDASFEFTVSKVSQTDEGNQGYTIRHVSSGRYLGVTQSLQEPVDTDMGFVYCPGGTGGYQKLSGYVCPTHPYVYLTDNSAQAAVWYWENGSFYTRYTTDISAFGNFAEKKVDFEDNVLQGYPAEYSDYLYWKGSKIYRVYWGDDVASFAYTDADDPDLKAITTQRPKNTWGSNCKLTLMGINSSTRPGTNNAGGVTAQILHNPLYMAYLRLNMPSVYPANKGCATLGVYGQTFMASLFINYGEGPAAEKADLTLYKKVTSHTLTVTNGEGSGQYLTGQTVSISADSQTSTQHFVRWDVTGSATVADPQAASTTVTMGDGDATVTAVYEDHVAGSDDHDCTTALTCETCGYIMVPAEASHDYTGTCKIYDNSRHIVYCSHDGCTSGTIQYCYGGTAGYFTLANCEMCGQAYGSYAKDTTPPTGTITDGTHTWESLLPSFLYDAFFKDTVEVTLTAKDDSYSHQGYTDDKAVTIEYYIDNGETPLTAEDLANVSFTPYTGPLMLHPESQSTVYAKLTDHAGNVTYISSDRIILDTTLPVITGLEEGKTYCGAVTASVEDLYLDYVTVTVNGTPVSVTNGQFTVQPADGPQTIVVTDKSGNETSCTITVNDGHTFTDYTYNNDETCTQDGTETATCDYCDATNTRTAAGTRHAHTMTHVDAVAATCSQTGNVEYWHCEECGLNYNSVDGGQVIDDVTTPIDPSNHNLTHHAAVDATCVATGNVEYWHCEDCGVNLDSDENGAVILDVVTPIDPSNHNLTHHAAVDATCVATGNVEYWHCEDCGLNFDSAENGAVIDDVTTPINPDNHDLTHHAAVDATCTQTGNVEYWHCENCGVNLDSDENGTVIDDVVLPIDPDNHDLIHHQAKAATCEQAGYNAYDTCSRCDYTTYTEIAALGHKYGEPTLSWSEDGKTCTFTFTCQNDPSHVLIRTVPVSDLNPTDPSTPSEGGTGNTGSTGDTGSDTPGYTVDIDDGNGHTITVTIPESDIPAAVRPNLPGTAGENGSGDSQSPATGDSRNFVPLFAALLVSGWLLITLVSLRRRKKS